MEPNAWQRFAGYFDEDAKTNVDGWGSTAFSIGGSLLDGYLGMRQYGLMKDQLAFQKQAFETNLQNQRTLTNSQLRDRQTARYRHDPRWQSPSEYMQTNGV